MPPDTQVMMHMDVKGHDFVTILKMESSFLSGRQKKMSLSFSINATRTLGYQSSLAASPLTYCVRVLSELQARQDSTAHHLFEVKGTCNVTSNSANICDRMESSKQQRTKKGQPDSGQIWLPCTKWFATWCKLHLWSLLCSTQRRIFHK